MNVYSITIFKIDVQYIQICFTFATVLKNKYLKLILRLILSVAAVLIIARKVDLHTAFEYLQRANPGLIFLSMISYAVSKIVAAFRIEALYKTQGLDLGRIQNIKLTFLAMFYNLFIPVVGGEGYKSFWINKRHKTPIKSLVWAALLDRGSGLAWLAVTAVLIFQFCSFKFPFSEFSLILIPFVLIAHYGINRIFFKSFLPAWLSTGFFSFIIQSLQAVTAWLVVLALGVDALQTEYVFVFMLASFAYIIPVAGAREMAFVFGSGTLGLDMEISLVIGILFYLALAISSLCGSWFVLFPSSLNKDKEGLK